MRLLTDEERKRFVQWLLEDAESSELIAKQMLNLPGLSAVAEMNLREAEAERLIAKKLLNTESFTI